MIHNDEHEVITVFVDHKANRFLRPFYCCRCSKYLCQISGDARVLLPGLPDDKTIDELKISVSVLCDGGILIDRDSPRVKCTAKYIFQ